MKYSYCRLKTLITKLFEFVVDLLESVKIPLETLLRNSLNIFYYSSCAECDQEGQKEELLHLSVSLVALRDLDV